MGVDLENLVAPEDFTKKNEKAILSFFNKLDDKFPLQKLHKPKIIDDVDMTANSKEKKTLRSSIDNTSLDINSLET